MTKMKLLLLSTTSMLLLISACKEQTISLCDCISTKAFKQNYELSPECIEACKNEFGDDLQGMEAWFAENCSPYESNDTLQAYLKPEQRP